MKILSLCDKFEVVSWMYETRCVGKVTTDCPRKKMCNVVCYREKEEEFSFLTLIYLNQQALGLTVKTVGERMSSYPHTVTCSLLNKGRSLGSITLARPDGVVEEESQMIGSQNFGAKMPLPVGEIWRRIFNLGQNSVLERQADFQPTPGKVTRKKSGTEFGDRSQREKHADLRRLREVTHP